MTDTVLAFKIRSLSSLHLTLTAYKSSLYLFLRRNFLIQLCLPHLSIWLPSWIIFNPQPPRPTYSPLRHNPIMILLDMQIKRRRTSISPTTSTFKRFMLAIIISLVLSLTTSLSILACRIIDTFILRIVSLSLLLVLPSWEGSCHSLSGTWGVDAVVFLFYVHVQS